MVNIGINLGDIDGGNDFDLMPDGWYKARVNDSESKTSKAGNNFIKWEFLIEGPSHAGRKVWDNMVLNNEFALKRLKAMAIACGFLEDTNLADSEELHGKLLQIKLGVEEGKDGYDDKNKVVAFRSYDNEIKPVNKKAEVADDDRPGF